jgi:hypothetical protein
MKGNVYKSIQPFIAAHNSHRSNPSSIGQINANQSDSIEISINLGKEVEYGQIYEISNLTITDMVNKKNICPLGDCNYSYNARPDLTIG